MEGPSNSWLTSIIRVDWADDEEMVSTPPDAIEPLAAEPVEAVEPLAAEPVTPPEALEPMYTSLARRSRPDASRSLHAEARLPG